MSVLPFVEPRGSLAVYPPPLSYNEGKGHLSVNPICGCSLGCPYCLNLSDGIGRERRVLAPVGELVRTLADRADLVRQLRLSVMDFCDPFDPTVLPVLRELLEGLQDRLPGQVVLLTSRLHPGQRWLDWLGSLSLRVSVFVSLGDATGRVPAVTPVAPRLQLLEDCHDRGLHSVMLLRPLVREWT
ncbi:MAG TPA: radical SAM protein, partial [Myxococcales bacterium]